MSTETRPKVKYNRFEFYADNGFGLLLLDNRTEIDGEPNPAYRKRPVAQNWQHRKGLNPSTAYQRMKAGFNIGAAIPEGFLVIDIDTRNGGLESFRDVIAKAFPDGHLVTGVKNFENYGGDIIELGGPSIDDALGFLSRLTYAVRTSNKGHHFYFKCPPGVSLASRIAPGVDVLAFGRQVVTPGSVHPKTGEIYTAVGAGVIAELPSELEPFVIAQTTAFTEDDLSDLKDGVESRRKHSLWKVVDDFYDVERLLCALPPTEYSDYNKWWFPLLCACHHASGGEENAKQAFINWSSWDPKYASEAKKAVESKWDSIDRASREGKSNIATIRTLLNAAERECKKLIVSGLEPSTLLRSRWSDGDCFYSDGATLFPKTVTIDDVLQASRRVREGILASSLVEIKDEEECSKLLQWIDSLKPGWEKIKPELKNRIIDVAASLDEKLWPEISAALSKASTYSVSAAKIERQIRDNKKETVQEVDNENYDLTQAELIEAVATMAMKAMVGHDGFSDDFSEKIISPANGRIYKYVTGKWIDEPQHVIDGLCYAKALEVADLRKKSTKPATDTAEKATATIIKKAASRETGLYTRKELPNCINLKNGTLWFENGKPPEFKSHNKDDLLTTQLPYDYDPKAICPDFDTMLDQVFEHAGPEKPELIRHFFEIMGYMIQPNKDIPKILIWTGEGQNGKSRIAKTISKLVGDDAWLRTDLNQFFSDKQPHNLHAAENKLVLMDDDLRTGTELNDGALKKISETTSILVNPKNRDAYMVRLQLIPLIIANSSPRIRDISRGMVRRLDVIEWATNIERLKDSPLPDRVDAHQLPGVLNRAIEGLARLRSRGDFSPPACSLMYRERFLEKANTIYGFWGSLFKIELPGAVESLSSLYEDYKAYMFDQSEGRPAPLAVFRENLRRCGPCIEGDNVLGWVIATKDKTWKA